ncbi:hypothetical protein Ndes2526A_g01356 [Nannochloris sp. 'desiccata']|nr:hypothetical protein KSW81_004298 [Chlorella desiccata (nom. nud.)]
MIRRSAAIVANLAQQLEARSSSVMLVNLPNSSRSLIAAKDIEAGSVIHRDEQPMLCSPSPAAIDITCASCLRPVPPLSVAVPGNNKAVGESNRQHRFCSIDCEQTALDTWLQIDLLCDFSALQTACKDNAEKFPLMAARLACMALQQHQDENEIISKSTENLVSSSKKVMRGDPLKDLSSLCYAKIPQAPDDWSNMHAMLLQGLSTSGLSTSKFDLEWYCWVLSRLHLNVFRVDTVPPLDIQADPAALFKAAAAVVSGGGAPQGSAVYLLGSMFNHSCEPNVDVTFPNNNAEIAFVAATDIAKNTELCISYIDAGGGRAARQEQLRYAYGFLCNCPKCIEEKAM